MSLTTHNGELGYWSGSEPHVVFVSLVPLLRTLIREEIEAERKKEASIEDELVRSFASMFSPTKPATDDRHS